MCVHITNINTESNHSFRLLFKVASLCFLLLGCSACPPAPFFIPSFSPPGLLFLYFHLNVFTWLTCFYTKWLTKWHRIQSRHGAVKDPTLMQVLQDKIFTRKKRLWGLWGLYVWEPRLISVCVCVWMSLWVFLCDVFITRICTQFVCVCLCVCLRESVCI